MTEQSRIDTRHRITLPHDAFRQAGLRPGDAVTVRAQGPGRIVIECAEALDDTNGSVAGAYGDHFTESLLVPWRR